MSWENILKVRDITEEQRKKKNKPIDLTNEKYKEIQDKIKNLEKNLEEERTILMEQKKRNIKQDTEKYRELSKLLEKYKKELKNTPKKFKPKGRKFSSPEKKIERKRKELPSSSATRQIFTIGTKEEARKKRNFRYDSPFSQVARIQPEERKILDGKAISIHPTVKKVFQDNGDKQKSSYTDRDLQSAALFLKMLGTIDLGLSSRQMSLDARGKKRGEDKGATYGTTAVTFDIFGPDKLDAPLDALSTPELKRQFKSMNKKIDTRRKKIKNLSGNKKKKIEQELKQLLRQRLQFIQRYGQEEEMKITKPAQENTIETYFDKSLLNILQQKMFDVDLSESLDKQIISRDYVTKLNKLIEGLLKINFTGKQYAFLKSEFINEENKGEKNKKYNAKFKTPNKARASTIGILELLGGDTKTKLSDKEEKPADKKDKIEVTRERTNEALVALLENWANNDKEKIKISLRDVEEYGMFERNNIVKINKLLFQGEPFLPRQNHPFINYEKEGKVTWDEDENSWGVRDEDNEWEDRIRIYRPKNAKQIWEEILDAYNLTDSGIESGTRKERKRATDIYSNLFSTLNNMSKRIDSDDELLATRITDKYKKLEQDLLNVNKESVVPKELKDILNNERQMVIDMFAMMLTLSDIIDYLEDFDEIEFDKLTEDKPTTKESNKLRDELKTDMLTLRNKNKQLEKLVPTMEFLYSVLKRLGKTVDIDDDPTFKQIKNKKVVSIKDSTTKEIKVIALLDKKIKPTIEDTERIIRDVNFTRNETIDEAIDKLFEIVNEDEDPSINDSIAKALRKVKRNKILLERSL